MQSIWMYFRSKRDTWFKIDQNKIVHVWIGKTINVYNMMENGNLTLLLFLYSQILSDQKTLDV